MKIIRSKADTATKHLDCDKKLFMVIFYRGFVIISYYHEMK